ncbi:MAG: hypothetical protein OM95_15760 [Bdellovibrio sp. ArHS]|uniref:Mut7-C RNAse domain-containing protein n=1 Tax=Bdellovibrio sp. ArHS TaxID=1569284 RepID=UPI0005839D4F|nr:Mut7-C RNAse domain-containing protein [Bdellovibrio sp. ArHS]KHD87232.1 MAG: hypothetical protein OM95_15760 [Bdellovibrio sp. ArHS]
MNEKPAFLVDENLLGLVRWLRMMGFDTASFKSLADDELLKIATHQKRILLTRDRLFFARLPKNKGYFVVSEDPEAQLREVLKNLHIIPDDQALSRCFICNTPIEKVDREQIKDKVDGKTYALYETFYWCPHCQKVYWEGSHFSKMLNKVEEIRRACKS